MKALVFLQNAWSPLYAGRKWPRESWLRALLRSRSGTRLLEMTTSANGTEFHFENTTPICGDCPDSVVPPCKEHIAKVITAQNPDCIVCCGKQAEDALQMWGSRPKLILPHPAYRVLTNALYRQAGQIIANGFTGTITLRQERQHPKPQGEKRNG